MQSGGLQGYPFEMNIHNFLCDSDGNATAKITFSGNDFCLSKKYILPSYLIECMGQVVEKCLSNSENSKKRYLARIDEFVINRDFKDFIGVTLTVIAKKIIKMGNLSRYCTEIYCENTKICSCVITHSLS